MLIQNHSSEVWSCPCPRQGQAWLAGTPELPCGLTPALAPWGAAATAHHPERRRKHPSPQSFQAATGQTTCQGMGTRGAGSHCRLLPVSGRSFKDALVFIHVGYKNPASRSPRWNHRVLWGLLRAHGRMRQVVPSTIKKTLPGFPTTLEHNVRSRTLGLKSREESS